MVHLVKNRRDHVKGLRFGPWITAWEQMLGGSCIIAKMVLQYLSDFFFLSVSHALPKKKKRKKITTGHSGVMQALGPSDNPDIKGK